MFGIPIYIFGNLMDSSLMYYKLYIDRSKPSSRLPDNKLGQVYAGFQEIYLRYGVSVIGAWENAEDPSEGYLITAYRDKTHYEETVAKMRVDPEYVKLSEDLQGTRESVKVVPLRLLQGSTT